ncbi:unnamed protein product, partial [Symbiodinium natans]
DVRSSTLNHRYEHGWQAAAPLKTTSKEVPVLALALLACSAVARSAFASSAAKRVRVAPKPRCVLVAATSQVTQCACPSTPGPLISIGEAAIEAHRAAPPVEMDGLRDMQNGRVAWPARDSQPGAQRRRRSADQGARQRRRAFGARLMGIHPVPQPDSKLAALDMSKVRNKVQMGIRSTSTARCGNNGRE